MVRAKFYVVDKRNSEYNGNPSSNITLYGVFTSQDGRDGNATEENLIFGKYTPGADIHLTIVNPDAAAQFDIGKEYYVDFTLAE